MKPKLSDVAKYAGVSLATADRVINNRSGVREVTRKKVMEAVAKLGYEPDPVAARLARARKLAIAIVIPGDGHQITKSIERYWHLIQKSSIYSRVQLRLAVYQIGNHANMVEQVEAISQQVDGILLTAADTEETRQLVRKITQSGIPVFSVFSRLAEGFTNRYIGYDHFKIGRTAIHFLKILTNGQVGQILTHSSFLQMLAYQDRLDGQQAYLDDHDWPCELVQITTDPKAQEVKDHNVKLVDYLDKHQDVIAITCLGQETKMLTSYLEENPELASRLKIVSVVIDMEKHIIDALRDGRIDVILYLDASKVISVGISALIEDLEKNCYEGGFVSLPSEILDFNVFVKDNIPQWALALSE